MTSNNRYRLIVLFAISVVICSCNPFLDKTLRKKNQCNNRLEKLVVKCPNLLQTDTIIDTVQVVVPEIRIDTFILTNTDLSAVDSIVSMFKGEIDSLTGLKLTERIKWYVKERPCIIDTLSFVEYGVQVNVYQYGQEIRVSIFKPEEVIEEGIEIEVQKVGIEPLTLLEQARIFMGRSWTWIVVCVCIGMMVALLPRIIKIFRI